MADRPAFEIGELVYHKTADTPGVLIGLIYREDGMQYEVSWQGRGLDKHYGCELTRDRPYFSEGGEAAG